jgi:hypothetical protein
VKNLILSPNRLLIRDSSGDLPPRNDIKEETLRAKALRVTKKGGHSDLSEAKGKNLILFLSAISELS